MTICPGAMPTIWLIAPRAWGYLYRHWSWHRRARSTHGCDLAASSAGKTRCPAWTGRARSHTNSSSFSVRMARCYARSGPGRRVQPTPFEPTAGTNSRSLLLLSNQPGDLADRIQMFDTGFMSFGRDSEVLLEEHDQLESRDRVEDSAGDQRCAIGQFPGILSWQELVQDVTVDDLLDVFHDGLWISSRSQRKPGPSHTTQRRHAILSTNFGQSRDFLEPDVEVCRIPRDFLEPDVEICRIRRVVLAHLSRSGYNVFASD